MNIETIEKRKEELLQQIEQAKAQFNALTGAVQDCDYWLKELDKEKKK